MCKRPMTNFLAKPFALKLFYLNQLTMTQRQSEDNYWKQKSVYFSYFSFPNVIPDRRQRR